MGAALPCPRAAVAGLLVVLAAQASTPAGAAQARFRHVHPEETAELSSGNRPLELEDIAKLEFRKAQESWAVQQLMASIRLFMRSAQKGHEVGEYCFRWGRYHELAPADLNQAVRWYSRGARMKHQACTTMLGKMHLMMGHKDKAKDVLTRTAAPNGDGGATGDSLAQWFLAEMSSNGGRLREAVRWWKRSAENGDVDAMMRLFQIFTNGGQGIPKEALRGRHWLYAAAAHGHQEALGFIEYASPTQSKVEHRWIKQMEDQGWC